MSLCYRFVVDDGEDIFADEEDLGGRDVGHSEDDIAWYFLRHNCYKLVSEWATSKLTVPQKNILLDPVILVYKQQD